MARTLSAGRPPSSAFSHPTWPRSMSMPMSAASVEIRSVPAGVTCCHRISCFILSVQATVARPETGAAAAVMEAGATVWASTAVVAAARPISSRSALADRVDMTISFGSLIVIPSAAREPTSDRAHVLPIPSNRG